MASPDLSKIDDAFCQKQTNKQTNKNKTKQNKNKNKDKSKTKKKEKNKTKTKQNQAKPHKSLCSSDHPITFYSLWHKHF